jgi:hypothetical protein
VADDVGDLLGYSDRFGNRTYVPRIAYDAQGNPTGLVGGPDGGDPLAALGAEVAKQKSFEYFGAGADGLHGAIASVDTESSIFTGGKINIPTGDHAVSATVSVDNNSEDGILGVSLIGSGKQAATLNFSTQPSGNGLEYTAPIFASIKDLCVRQSKGDGVKFVGFNTNPALPAWNHLNIEQCRFSFNAGSGIEADRGFMGSFNQAFASHNSDSGFKFNGFHTSLHFNNCYAASNTINGYAINNATYSALTACASDLNTWHGYRFTSSSTVVVNGCGSESNGRSGLSAEASTTLGQNYPIQVNGFLAFNNNTSNGGFPNAIHVKSSDGTNNIVLARGCRSHNPAHATVDALVDGLGAYLVDEFNSFPNGAASSNCGYIHHVPLTKYVHAITVTGATPICALKSPQNQVASYGGEILIHARNNTPNSATSNTATYKLIVNRGTGGSAIATVSQLGLISGSGASHPSFTWTHVGNELIATPIGSTSGIFYFEVLTSGFVKTV